MTRRTLWLVAAILSLGIPLVSTAGGAPGPPQAGATQTPKPAQSGSGQPADPDKDWPEPSDEPLQAGQLAPKPPAATQPQNIPTPEAAKAAADPVKEPAMPAKQPQPPAAPVEEPVEAEPVFPTPATPEEAKQQQLQRDTAHLLRLVKELKFEVDKAGRDTLSLAAVRKADEIQRLAKNLKERMKEREQVPVNRP